MQKTDVIEAESTELKNKIERARRTFATESDVLGCDYEMSTNVPVGEEDDGLSITEILDVLSSERRVRLLLFMTSFDYGDKIDLGETSVHIAAWEDDCSLHDVMSEDRKRIYIPLYQHHLPVLDNLDIIDFDKRAGEISHGTEYGTALDVLLDCEDLLG